jgi:hypothetical protein
MSLWLRMSQWLEPLTEQSVVSLADYREENRRLKRLHTETLTESTLLSLHPRISTKGSTLCAVGKCGVRPYPLR